MAVKKIETKRNRIGTRFCEKRGLFVGYKIDVWINGKRYRNRIFPTKKEAENFIGKLKLEESAEKFNFTDDSIVEIFLAVREKRIGLSEFKKHLTDYLRARILGK
jgi:hypothetical protein